MGGAYGAEVEDQMTFGTFNIDLFLLVFMRITGFIILNPLFGRTTVPNLFKVAFSLLFASIVTPTLNVSVNINGVAPMVLAALMELTIGLAIGVVINIIFAVVTLAGEMVDMQMGLGMAMMYDPGSGVNMPIMGNFFNIILMVVFFAGNAHLALLSLVSDSFKAIAPGTAYPTTQSAQFVVSMGKDLFDLGLRMAVPVIAVEVIGLIAIGLLMKAVPQINIFMVGIQIQTIIGIIIVLLATPILTALCDRLTAFILEKSAEFIRLLVH
jgi:flagellar biosynthetic protein FliR